MADSRIIDLPLAEEITDNDFFVFDGLNGGTKKIAKGTLFENIENAIEGIESNVTDIESEIESIETNITDIENKIGDTALPTTAQTLSGAIAEHENDITELNSNLTSLTSNIGDWKNITFSGTYSGELDGVYNDKLKLAIVNYNSKKATAEYTATMNVTAKKSQFGALRNGGYLQVSGTGSTISITNSAQYSVGQIIFTIL
jgi:archaellum component FlaC